MASMSLRGNALSQRDERAMGKASAGWNQHRAGVRITRNAALGAVVGLAALGIAFAAHLHGRPITAALLAVFGVTVVGALMGVRAGVISGVVASLTYNLLLTDPFLRFSLASADDLVPIIALNVSAIASGLIAGRLHDRAVAAEAAGRLVAELLAFSQALQRSLTLGEIEDVARQYIVPDGGCLELFVEVGGQLSSPSNSELSARAAAEVWSSRMPELRVGDSVGLILATGEKRLGLIVVEAGDGAAANDNVRSFLPLLALAVQRWLLASELSEADAVRRSESFKTALLSSVSHDLRTPLAAISASATSLAAFDETFDTATKHELLATIREQCDRLDRLTTNLLNIGRIEGGLDVQLMPVIDGIEVLGSALARVRQLHPHHIFDKEFRARSASVRADEALLEQVFMNVCANAAVHTAPGTKVRVSAATSRSSLHISVQDDGPGIPEGDRDRVFERFFQGTSNGRTQSGSGLGLSIAKGFAERIGGTIKATSAVPALGGASIEIVLPLAT
jgi:two-component system sensor histidine kinase KdpD